MDAAEEAVAAIVKARNGKPAKRAKGAKSQQVALNKGPTAPTVPAARNANGTFAKGNVPAAPFPPGVSGNPAGRTPMRDALTRLGDEADALYPGMKRTDAAALALWRKSCAGDVQAFREIADRTEGKVAQTVEVGNKPGQTLEVTIDARDVLTSAIARLAAGVEEGSGDSVPDE